MANDNQGQGTTQNQEEQPASVSDQPFEATEDVAKGCFGSLLLLIAASVTTLGAFLLTLLLILQLKP